MDKYFYNVKLDLSKVTFIFSYNDVDLMDRILLDRIHRIKFKHLSLKEKITTKKYPWYIETGSGMGPTLNVRVNLSAYTITDRSSWIFFGNKKNHLILVENEPILFNYYGIIPINPEKCKKVKKIFQKGGFGLRDSSPLGVASFSHRVCKGCVRGVHRNSSIRTSLGTTQ